MLVKEYMDENTKIRIHDDFYSSEDDKSKIKEIIISLMIKKINENELKDLQ